MKAIQLRPYQTKAIDAVQTALNSGQKHMVVEMAAGSGKGLVLAKTMEILHKHKTAKKKVCIPCGKCWYSIITLIL